MNKKGLIFLVCSIIVLMFTAFYYFPNYYNFYILDEYDTLFNGSLEYTRGFEVKKDTELVFTSMLGLSDMQSAIYTEDGNEIINISELSKNKDELSISSTSKSINFITDLSKDKKLIRIHLIPGKYFFKISGQSDGQKKKISYNIAYKRFEMAWQRKYNEE
ncbi:MAG: hypothetical protein KBA07_09150 [Petrotogaceae bacterium]|jgi:hypothetical protein|nr:hypothetical protein [Petrotogaceae bacterium]